MDRINTLIIKLQNRKQEGQGMVEYALILGLVSVAAIAALGPLSEAINGMFGTVTDALTPVAGT